MRLMTLASRQCDLCGSEDGVTRYRIEYVAIGRSLTADLCATHRKPLERLREKVPPKGGRLAGPRRRPVVTEAQVKRARRKKKASDS